MSFFKYLLGVTVILLKMSLKVFILKILPPALKLRTVFSRYAYADQSQPYVCKKIRLNNDNLDKDNFGQFGQMVECSFAN